MDSSDIQIFSKQKGAYNKGATEMVAPSLSKPYLMKKVSAGALLRDAFPENDQSLTRVCSRR